MVRPVMRVLAAAFALIAADAGGAVSAQRGHGAHGMMADGGHQADMQLFHQLFTRRALRDPLFREIFSNADKIEVQVERTENWVRVIETSADPDVARLFQAHAEVVDAFIANGHAEMMKNHPVP
ncbi:MAG TPA: hypothetical protein VH436_18565 [Vicinamibacterales bacterium]